VSLFGVPETRPILVDLTDTRESLELDSPTRCTLHLKKPNVEVKTDTVEMLDPQKVAWRLKVQHGGRHQANGEAFLAQIRGRAVKRWSEHFEGVVIASGGMVDADDNGKHVRVPVEQAVRELR